MDNSTTTGLTFKELRKANLERVTEFGHGDIHSSWGPAEWGLALCGEAGELANVLKKMIRQAPWDPTKETLLDKAADELADVQIYLDLLAAHLRIDLAAATRRKFNETSDRYNLTVHL